MKRYPTLSSVSWKAVIAQRGAREHFLVARALYRYSRLAQLIVDWYVSPSDYPGRMAEHVTCRALRRALGANAPGIPDKLVRSLNLYGLWFRFREMSAGRKGRIYDAFLQNDTTYAKTLARMELPEHDVFFGYSYASLEAITAERSKGKLTILDQIDPGPTHYEILCMESEMWPDYAGHAPTIPDEYFRRVRREWEVADIIIVNSEWSYQCLVSQGVPPDKIKILPLAYNQNIKSKSSVRGRPALLRILWVGSVNIGKGIQYLVEAARKLERTPVEFLIAGPLGIKREAVLSAPRSIRWLGQVPRTDVGDLYQSCDVFVLPTLSDGFAITQLEALAHGLPVIITPNCGRVVEDGVTGFVIEPRNPDALAEAVIKFVQNPQLLSEMKPRCVATARKYNIDNYGKKLVEIIERRLSLL